MTETDPFAIDNEMHCFLCREAKFCLTFEFSPHEKSCIIILALRTLEKDILCI